PDRAVALAVLRRMSPERIPTRLATLTAWLREERDPERIAALLDSLDEHPAPATRESLQAAVAGRTKPPTARLAALSHLVVRLDAGIEPVLTTLAGAVEDGPVLAEVLRQAGKRPGLNAVALLRAKLDSPDGDVRAAAIESLPDVESARLQTLL